MMFDMLKCYNYILQCNVNIVYCGPIWADGVEGIAGTLRKHLECGELPLSASQSVFSVFVEQMNNMLMYSSDRDIITRAEKTVYGVAPKGLFVMGVSNTKSYFIQTGNIMKTKSVDLVKERIDHLNKLDKAELRKFYKEQIKKENDNLESRGAGLGLIEIARRASSKIEYDFTPLENDLTFFTMYVTI